MLFYEIRNGFTFLCPTAVTDIALATRLSGVGRLCRSSDLFNGIDVSALNFLHPCQTPATRMNIVSPLSDQSFGSTGDVPVLAKRTF